MMFDFVGVLILVVLLALFAFLFVRSWGSKRIWLKALGSFFAGLLTLAVLLVLVVALIGYYKLNAPQPNPVSNLKAGGTPEQVARIGRYASLCAGCHSTAGKLPVDGSKDNFGVDPRGGPSLGVIYPPNLTPAGPLKDWSDGEIVRAIREGVHKNGRALIIMPSESFRNISDADIQALVAFLRSQPPTPHDTPENNIALFGAILIGAGVAPLQTNQPAITQPITAPPAGPTLEYGKYVVSWAGCRSCHGQDLAGGTPGGFEPAGPNLTAVVPKWSEADFMKAIRTGVTPEGKALDPDQMPWREYSTAFNEDDLKAVYAFLKTLAPIIKPAK